ncbi:hypothetical protein NQD34_015049 [Periophthalmus magnuspinnatus]|nr:hypothetical protein NQD34_015049 [Periophthalmus magnuspinnatus]
MVRPTKHGHMIHRLKSPARGTEAHFLQRFLYRQYPTTKSDKMMKCGGTSEVKPADQKIQDIADSVKSQVEEKAGKKYCKFLVKSYKSQVVAGTNYFIKIQVAEEDHIHVRVFQGSLTLEVHWRSMVFRSPRVTMIPLSISKDSALRIFHLCL